jgi:hypothetical protein
LAEDVQTKYNLEKIRRKVEGEKNRKEEKAWNAVDE